MDTANTLLYQYENFIRAKARHLARDASEADELAQKASIILWQQCERLSSFREAAIKAFINKTLRNALIDIRRKERSIVSLEMITSPSERFEDSIVDKLTIMSVIHELSQQEQDIIFKVYFLGMDSRSIGEALNMPSSTVRSKQNRAQRKLKKILQK